MNKGMIFSLGAAIGLVVGWCSHKAYSQKQVDAEIAEMREHYREKEAVLEHSTRLEKPSLDSLREKYTSKAEYPTPEPSDDDEAPFEEFVTEESPMDTNYIPPAIITMEEFGEEVGYDTQELIYYQENGVLVNEDEEQIDDPDHLIGTALTKYNFEESDESDLFVRNENLSTDYHIHKVQDAIWEG